MISLQFIYGYFNHLSHATIAVVNLIIMKQQQIGKKQTNNKKKTHNESSL